MINMSHSFIADDTMEKYRKTLDEMTKHAFSLGVDTVYISALMDNPDGTTEKSRKMLVNNILVGEKESTVRFLQAVRKHIDGILRGEA